MQYHRAPHHNSYALTEDALHILQDNDVQFETASNSTASGLPGLGRTLDVPLNALGGALDGVLATAFNRLKIRKQKPQTHSSLQQTYYDLESSAVDALRENDVEFETASSSTASDHPGLGRTLDKLYTSMGKVVENIATSALTRIGVGPDGVMIHLLRRFLGDYVKQCWCKSNNWRCPACVEFARTLVSLQHSRVSAIAALDGIILLSILTEGTANGSDRGLAKDCRKLIQCLKQDNLSSKAFAMAYIEALLTFIPEAATVFDQRGLQQHLKALIGRLSSLGYLQDTEDRLLASSRRALVSTANAKMLAMIKDYSAIEVTCEDKLDQALLADRLLPYLASFTSATFSSEAAYNSHLPALPIIKSFTRQPGPFWLHWVLTSSPHSFISAVNMRQWLWTAIAEKDLVRRALMLRIINSVLGSIGRDDMSVGASPWIWESVWLPVCEVVLARAGNTDGGQKRRRRMRLRDALDLQLGTMRTPCSLTVTLERQLLNLANKAESVRPPAPLPGIFDTVRSPVYRVFARFLYERRVIALGAREYCPLGFPAKVSNEFLQGLCERVTGLLTGCEDVPEEVLVICRKDKDCYEALLGSLRHARHGLSGREFDRVSKVLDRLASSRYEPSVVKLQLESKIQDAAHGYPNDEGRTHIGSRFYRSAQTRAVGFYPRLRDRHNSHDYTAYERLVGDLRSLRWASVSDLKEPSLSRSYAPIIGALDDDGQRQYLACFSLKHAYGTPLPYCFLVNEYYDVVYERDFQEQERLLRSGTGHQIYILTVCVPPGAGNDPHLYWASPSWNNRLCRCLDLGCRNSDRSHSDTYATFLHIPDALPDSRLVNTITLEETIIPGGEAMEVQVISWFANDPMLLYMNGKWCWFPGAAGL